MSFSSLKSIFKTSPVLYHFRVDFPVNSSRIQYGLKKLSQINNKKPAAIALTLNGISNNPQHGHTLYQAFYHTADKLRVPVYAFLQEQAVSTTYFTANCGTIYANPYCMIGEVGTSYKSYTNIKKLLDYIGIKVQWLGTREQHIWNQLTQVNPKQREFTEKWIQSIENTMIKTVSLRRNIPIETVRSLKNKLFSPQQAMKNKLIDGIGTFQDFKTVNFPNSQVKDVILNNKGYAKNNLERQQIQALMKLKALLDQPRIGVFEIGNPLVQAVKQLFSAFEMRLKNPQSLNELDAFIGQLFYCLEEEATSQSPLRFQ